MLGPPLSRVGAKNDISYGAYIYAFPLQQVLATFGLGRSSWVLFAAASILAVIPMAILSWFVIERPALRLKDQWAPRHSVSPTNTLGQAG